MSSAAYCAWKAEFGSPEVSNAKGLLAVENENTQPKRELAKAFMDRSG